VEPLTDYVLDTMALVRHLEDDLPRSADKVFRQAEDGHGRLFLPEIALAEFLYVALRGRLRVPSAPTAVQEVLNQLRAASYIVPSNLAAAAWDGFLLVNIPELHDRMIATDALYRGVPLVSGDSVFSTVPGLQVVWR